MAIRILHVAAAAIGLQEILLVSMWEWLVGGAVANHDNSAQGLLYQLLQFQWVF